MSNERLARSGCLAPNNRPGDISPVELFLTPLRYTCALLNLSTESTTPYHRLINLLRSYITDNPLLNPLQNVGAQKRIIEHPVPHPTTPSSSNQTVSGLRRVTITYNSTPSQFATQFNVRHQARSSGAMDQRMASETAVGTQYDVFRARNVNIFN